MPPAKQRLIGIAFATAGSVLWSTGGLFSRPITLDLTTTLMWRSLFAALSLIVFVVVRDGRRSMTTVRSLGWPGLVGIPISAVAMLGYVAALRWTTVANVMIVYATIPFVAAGIAFLWIGERTSRRVLGASALALVGVAILAGFSSKGADLAGDGMTLLMTVAFGVLLVMARRYPSIDMAPLNAGAALLCVLVCWPFAQPGWPDPSQLAIVAGFGIVCVGLAFVLFLTGGRYIPASEAGLLGFLDVVLGPIWMWLVFDERPSRAAVVGGAFVLASLVWYLVGEFRAGRARAAAEMVNLGATQSAGKSASMPPGQLAAAPENA